MTLVGNTNSKLSSDYNDGLIENTGSGGLTIENVWSDAGTIKEAGTGDLTLLNFSNTSGGGYISDDALVGELNLTNSSLVSSFLTSVAGSTINITSGSTSTIDEAIFTHGSVDIDSSTLIANNDYYNYGSINLEGSGTASVLELNGTLQLRGGGDLILANSAGNSIVTNGVAQTFENINDTISGFGTIGDANMFFKNSLNGTVDANTTSLLTINAGGGGSSGLFNAGILESTDTGGLTIDGLLTNEGTLNASDGTIDVTGNVQGGGVSTISGNGSIEFGGSVFQDVDFEAGATGTLILDHSSSDVPDEIYGFASGDQIDLKDINFAAGHTLTFNAALNESTLSVTDGTHTANLNFIGNYTAGSFSLASDGHGGTLVK